ncbi:MAG: hypothetical protein LBB56_03730 [Chitinispirillales bacterium]|jgi:hypothetical protein|nr:hypothetical protein [Chitinispirillales bacterium]
MNLAFFFIEEFALVQNSVSPSICQWRLKMRVYYWFISAFLLLPAVITAQFSSAHEGDTGAFKDTSGGSGGMNGAAAGYGAGWWFWTLLLLAILLTIVWWAVRAGGSSKQGRNRT